MPKYKLSVEASLGTETTEDSLACFIYSLGSAQYMHVHKGERIGKPCRKRRGNDIEDQWNPRTRTQVDLPD